VTNVLDAIGRTIALLIGVPLALAGATLAAFSGVAYFNHEWGYEAALFAATAYSSIAPLAPPMLPDLIIEHRFLGTIALLSLFAFLVGRGFVRRGVGTQDVSRHTLEVEGTPRVGQALDGRVRFLKPPKPGERFDLELLCSRTWQSVDSSDREERVFFAKATVPAAEDAAGWFVPFHCDLAPGPPPTNRWQQWRWVLRMSAADRWISAYSRFEIMVEAALPPEPAAMQGDPSSAGSAADALERQWAVIGGAPLKAQEVAQIRAMTPEQRAQMAAALSRRGPVASYLLKLFMMYTAIARRWK